MKVFPILTSLYLFSWVDLNIIPTSLKKHEMRIVYPHREEFEWGYEGACVCVDVEFIFKFSDSNIILFLCSIYFRFCIQVFAQSYHFSFFQRETQRKWCAPIVLCADNRVAWRLRSLSTKFCPQNRFDGDWGTIAVGKFPLTPDNIDVVASSDAVSMCLLFFLQILNKFSCIFVIVNCGPLFSTDGDFPTCKSRKTV